jgi:hypothetical protein
MLAIALRFTLVNLIVVWCSLVCVADEAQNPSIDSQSGLKIDAKENWKLVQAHCGSCHSGRLLAQQSLSREDWVKSIRRMQSNENLWDLGDAEASILDYLSDTYGLNETGLQQLVRRPLLLQEPIDPDSEGKQSESIQDENETSPTTEESNASPIQ